MENIEKVSMYKEAIYKEAINMKAVKEIADKAIIDADVKARSLINRVSDIGDEAVYRGAVKPVGTGVKKVGGAVAKVGDKGSPANRLGEKISAKGENIHKIPKKDLGYNTLKILGQIPRALGM